MSVERDFPEMNSCVLLPCTCTEICVEQEREPPADTLYPILFGSSSKSTREQ